MTREAEFIRPWASRIMLRTPQLFGQGVWDLKQTPIRFGFECGPGWFPLIEKTLGKLARIAREDGLDQMRIRQVKEKYSTLRIYLSGANVRASMVANAAEAMSAKTCDLCGGAVLTPPPKSGLIVTRCPACIAGKARAAEVMRSTSLDCGPGEKLYRVLILSDLHLDFWLEANEEPLPGLDSQVFRSIDLVILAGDLTNKGHVRWRMALEWLAERVSPDKIWAFPGNHDAYSGAIEQDEKLRHINESFGGRYAQKADIRLGGRRLLCATLWTDMRLGGDLNDNMAQAAKVMNDYKYIRMAAREYARLRPVDTMALHRDHLHWLDTALAGRFDGETIVITHHAPHPDCLTMGHSLPAAYASDLSQLIERHQPLSWVHGHLHQRKDFHLGRTRILNVALGYPEALDAEKPKNDPLAGLISWVGPKATN
ncbi:metallophosphoesterase [Cypionkella sp.]|uniref:metallophosphoesterase n=1 Tax=Cypionkella sp. TaxID=2811411 RepID=UPI002ABCA820|nr:metallophosphoesterase [Cypionkella sp.]MDZ4393320.1 metallophosphoesterase [Cypionkella sp.]